MMDESRYMRLVGDAFRKIEDALVDVDPGDVDLDSAGDVLTLTMKNGIRCIVNTQRPVRQIWLAARANAWHFDFEESTGRWLADKAPHDELFATLSKVTKEHAGIDIAY
ncbi:MAG: iron donor protein CyaY [Polyangiales bacterium]